MHVKVGLLSLEKASSHSTVLPSLLFFPLVYSVFVFHTTGCEAYSFMTDGYGIFNVHTNWDACRTHEGGSGTNKSAQTWNSLQIIQKLE